jgi:hypothetical protein
MERHWWLVIFVIFCAGSRVPTAAGHAEPSVLQDKGKFDFIGGNHLRGVQSNPPGSNNKKSCSEVYPVPEASKHWTGCKQGQYSQCGGPDDCACQDGDDRLIWYDCKEGSYALCEDDNTCKDSS